ncbi:MAG: SRPBCC family protein [Bacteroidaceae bacterium]|nr:SRPBCC family protein [Bacteroidaceae bacterium]MDD7525706.1 SRPBCC family protein [Prevotellaceae bacterium]MDY5759334.1 SRPBCC family protein [Bacteroidaceae bacterium]
MAKYESQIKQVPFSQSAVYAKLSDLTNLAVIKERIDDPNVQAKIPADKIEEVRNAVNQMEFTTDTVSAPAGPIGTIAVQIVDREPEKCVKFTSTNSPVSFKLWVQMLPTSDTTSKLKVTIDADLNFFMKQMVGSHLEKGVDKFADMLAMIPYE